MTRKRTHRRHALALSAFITVATAYSCGMPEASAQTFAGFAPQVTFPVGALQQSVAMGDLNGDGALDIATATYSTSSVSILIGDGTGGFARMQTFLVGAGPFSVAIGDLNNDGALDLAVANYDGATVSILLGDGAGSFAPQQMFAVGLRPGSVAIGDLNGDGAFDLAVTNRVNNTVSILLGDGAGGFAPQAIFPVGSAPRSVVMGDFNGDGALDLAVANSNSNNVSILLGDGAGSFAPQQTFLVGTAPRSVVMDDINKDGILDLAVANLDSNNVSILLGNGGGAFSPQVTFPVGTGAGFVSMGDLDVDGDIDLVVTNFGVHPTYLGSTVSILLGDGVGGFAPQQTFATGTGPVEVAMGDLDGNGSPDLAVANFNSGDVSVLINLTHIPVVLSSSDAGQLAAVPGAPSAAIAPINAGPAAGTMFSPIVNRHADLHVRESFDCTAGAGGIIASMGDVQVLPTPLPNVNNNVEENTMFIRVFDEQTQIKMATGAYADMSAPGVYDTTMSLPIGGVPIPAGSFVSSHFLHFDSVGNNNVTLGDVNPTSLTFESDVLGVMITGNPMFSTEDADPTNGPFFGAPGTIYPTTTDDPNGRRAWEIAGMSGMVTIGPNSRQVSFSARVQQFMDQMRIITAATPADVLAEPYVNSAGFITGVDEVTADNCTSAFYKFTFTLPAGFTGASLLGTANADDYGVVFLNGSPISPAILQSDLDTPETDRTDANGAALLSSPTPDAFGTSDPSLFVAGENTLVFGVLSDPTKAPSGLEFQATVSFDVPPDLNADGVVNGADLATLLTQWGTNGPADLNSDGVVNGADLAQLLTNWGPVQ